MACNRQKFNTCFTEKYISRKLLRLLSVPTHAILIWLGGFSIKSTIQKVTTDMMDASPASQISIIHKLLPIEKELLADTSFYLSRLTNVNPFKLFLTVAGVKQQTNYISKVMHYFTLFLLPNFGALKCK